MVPDEDLLTANSAMWVADTVSDLAGYGLGGLFVAFLGLGAVAGVLDRRGELPGLGGAGGGGGDPARSLPAAGQPGRLGRRATAGLAASRPRGQAGGSCARETVLFATTVQAAIAEYGLGALTALSPLLVAALPLGRLDAPTAYGFFEMSMGVGLRGRRRGHRRNGGAHSQGAGDRGRLHGAGRGLMLSSVTGSLWLALVLAAVVGLANVVFVVPSQTIFQQRTPDEMLGRVVAIRLALVNAMLAVSMATSGLLAQIFGLDVVLAGCGILAAAAGLAGLAVRAIREA